jgi:hypothetical protein
MDGFEKTSLEEDNFGASGGIVKAFDAFRMALPAQLLPRELEN